MTFQFPGFTRRLHLDFETYSECDLKSAGVHRYAEDPSTEVLMLGWAFDDEPEQLWHPFEGQLPERLVAGLRDPSTAKTAFNATFERLIMKHVLGIYVPVGQWRCTMVCAYYLGFTGGLDAVLSQSALNYTKDPRGQRLIQLFCKPAPRNHKVDRYTRENRPEDFADFGQYCKTDVRVERELLLWLAQYPMMHEWDWQRYTLDQRINDRGIYLDRSMAAGALEAWEAERKALTQKLKDLSGLSKVTREPFKEWLASHGFFADTMGKDDMAASLKQHDWHDDVREAVGLWIEKEGKAATKYASMMKGMGDDQRARGMFQFKGASRTDRTAGRRIQLQNLRRSFAKPAQIGTLVSAVRTAVPGIIEDVAGMGVSAALGGSVRHALQAPPGRTLVVYDLTSIESVVLGWLTYCHAIDQTFRSGRDTYKVFGSAYYNVAYEDVTKEQRSFSKPPVLGCGYMLGWKGLIAYAEGYGVAMDEESARRAVSTFRDMYPEIPQFWNWIYEAVKYTILTGNPLEGYRLRIERDQDFLRIWLPSGRALSYYQPNVSRRPAPWAEPKPAFKDGCVYTVDQLRAEFFDKDDQWLSDNGWIMIDRWVDNVSYMGTDLKTTQWKRVYAHAGLFTENIVQSMAMDILFDGITRSEAEGIEIVLQVHDELGAESDLAQAAHVAERLKQHMSTPPSWAPDMWLGADGYISPYYMKD
jgi:DNA polymerase